MTADLCPICEGAFAATTVATATQTVRACRRCANLIEKVMLLMGAEVVARRPTLEVVK